MKDVRVIRMDRSGHFQGVMDVEEFRAYDWTARREVVIVGDTQVETFEDFLRATEQSQNKTPEVWFFPPMAGG